MSSLRFLVDANIGMWAATALRDDGHDVLFVGDLDWRMSDSEVLSVAKLERRIILTMDNDFGEMIYTSKSPHAGVLLLRIPGANRLEKVRIVQEIIKHYGRQLPDHFCVYRQGKLRIRR